MPCAAVFGLSIAIGVGCVVRGQGWPRANPAEVLAAYAGGNYVGADEGLAIGAIDAQFLSQLRDAAERWVAAGPSAGAQHRAFIAGTLALDAVHASVGDGRRVSSSGGLDRSAFDQQDAQLKTIIWADGIVRGRAASSVSELERRWDLACLATVLYLDHFQGWSAEDPPDTGWLLVLGGTPAPDAMAPPAGNFGRGGLLGRILTRFPSDARFRLAAIEGRESVETRCIPLYCADEATPDALAAIRKRASSTPPDMAAGPNRAMLAKQQQMAQENLADFQKLPAIAAQFTALAQDPAVRAEANVHVGYLAIRSAHYEAALPPLLSAVDAAADPYVRYLAEFFIGRAQDGLDRRDGAIAAYRRALAVVPNASSAATLLAAQLFSSDRAAERAEAYSVVHAANEASPPPLDPWTWYWQGDAHLWSLYMAQLRDALR